LAKRLGLSQGWLSRIERGDASLSAEQLLYATRIFNASVDRFLPKRRGPSGDQIQNALARLGAAHLLELEGAFPTERLSDALNVIQEVLTTPDNPRHVSALTPVLVEQAAELRLPALRKRLAEAGLERRLGWLVDNTRWVLVRELEETKSIPLRTLNKYRRALSRLSHAGFEPLARTEPSEDIFDSTIVSDASIDEARKERSEISARWGILSFLQPQDFQSALRQVYAPD